MFNSICICGAGTMGKAIATLMAANSFGTVLYDINPQEPVTDLPYLTQTNDINNCIADLIIEAIVERPSAKIGLLNQLAEINHSETIFATNTSSLSVTSIAKNVQHPSRVAGLHFFNPVKAMKLVEIIKTEFTDPIVIQKLEQLCLTIGKISVTCNDSPGFIVNRVARPFYLEALRLAEIHNVPTTQIDELMQSTGFRMGPFRLMDLIGNDVNLAVSTSLYESLGKPGRLKPSGLQQAKVSRNELGRKTGKGFYNY